MKPFLKVGIVKQPVYPNVRELHNICHALQNTFTPRDYNTKHCNCKEALTYKGSDRSSEPLTF